MKIFWSWQSDLPNRENKTFIADALTDAAAIAAVNLGLDPADRPEIDSDTKGEPGLVEIAATIFKKVREATLFVADVTPIGTTRDGKQLGNPNVMIELGYALGTLGHKVLITVANTHFGGDPEQLPFDLRHRRGAILYRLAETATDKERAQEKKRLVANLAGAIVANLPAALAAKGGEKLSFNLQKAGADSEATWLPQSASFTHRDGSSSQTMTWSVLEGTKSYARIMPGGWTGTPPGRASFGSPPALGSTAAGWYGPNQDGFAQVFSYPLQDGCAGIVSQYFDENGEVWSFSSLVTDTVDGQSILAYGRIIKDWEQFLDKVIGRFLAQHAKPPFFVEVGVAGLNGTVFPNPIRAQRVAALDTAVRYSRVIGLWDPETKTEFLLSATNQLWNGYGLKPVGVKMLNDILTKVPA